MNGRTRKLLSIIFKAGILVFAFTFIFLKLNNNTNLQNFNKLIASVSATQTYIVLTGLFLFMLINWFLEALKWRFLAQTIQRLTIWESVQSVFCGLTLAIFTPNRIGEYGGRVFFLSPKRRILGVVAMAVGAVGQMVITNVLGAIALLWFVLEFLPTGVFLNYALAVVALAYSSFFLLLYFNIKWMAKLFVRVRILKGFRRFFKILERYQPADLLRVFFYCAARFLVFTTQYCIIIKLLIPEIALFSMIMMVCILFFIQSALPSLDLLDVGVRTMTATYFFGFITPQAVAIMAATACIWLINLIIPAILGAIFVFKLNFFGTNNH